LRDRAGETLILYDVPESVHRINMTQVHLDDPILQAFLALLKENLRTRLREVWLIGSIVYTPEIWQKSKHGPPGHERTRPGQADRVKHIDEAKQNEVHELWNLVLEAIRNYVTSDFGVSLDTVE